ncbi:MAG: phosphate ABC transporter permease PstA [Bacillota bacterium]
MRKAARIEQNVAFTILWLTAIVTILILAWIVLYIMWQGWPVVNARFLLTAPERMGRGGGISVVIIGTVYLTILSMFIATPVGVGAAIYLTEYQRQGKWIYAIRFFTETLAGIPSIVFGLFAYAFFAVFLKFGFSLLSGALALAMIVLPTVIRTSEEAIRAVDPGYKEASLALGATLWTTVHKVILPAALPGIVTGILLSIGRIAGESAALLLVCSSLNIPGSLMEPVKPMTLHLYTLAVEGLSMERAYGTAAVLIIMVLVLNLLGHWWKTRAYRN